MASRIVKLPPEVVNRIAAGEVVERPAAVIKELGENSLDAGAERIEIDIEAGGKQSIRIRDDGSGIAPDDLPLALTSHATSKLADATDLMHIASFGFRGEALASIGSVAHVTIRSRLNPARLLPGDDVRVESGDGTGFEITAANGELGPIKPCGCPPGTEVIVRELFATTPARFKFLKSNSAELSHVVEAVQRLAMPHAGVAFALRHDGRNVFELPAGQTTKERIVEFWGSECGDALREVHGYEADLRIEGYISTPAYSRPNSTRLMIFLNGRFIRDRQLLTAVREGYREFLPPGRYPAGVLFVDMPVTAYDVNVHPQKTEVRFREPRRLFARLRSVVRERLSVGAGQPRISLDAPNPSEIDSEAEDETANAIGGDPSAVGTGSFQEKLAALVAKSATRTSAETSGDSTATPPTMSAPGDAAIDEHLPTQEFVQVPAIAPKPITGGQNGARSPRTNTPPRTATPSRTSNVPSDLFPKPTTTSPRISDSAPLAGIASPAGNWHKLGEGVVQVVQVNNAIIIVEYAERLLLIDQHALHERVLFAHLQARWSNREIEKQRLLIPEPLDLTRAERAMLTDGEVRAALARIGFDIEFFPTDIGADEPRLTAVPVLLSRRLRAQALRRIIEDTLHTLSTAEDEGPMAATAELTGPEFPAIARYVLATLACKAAIKVGDSMTEPEVLALLDEADKIGTAYACPHGRPTTLELPYAKLNQYFGR